MAALKESVTLKW